MPSEGRRRATALCMMSKKTQALIVLTKGAPRKKKGSWPIARAPSVTALLLIVRPFPHQKDKRNAENERRQRKARAAKVTIPNRSEFPELRGDWSREKAKGRGRRPKKKKEPAFEKRVAGPDWGLYTQVRNRGPSQSNNNEKGKKKRKRRRNWGHARSLLNGCPTGPPRGTYQVKRCRKKLRTRVR